MKKVIISIICVLSMLITSGMAAWANPFEQADISGNIITVQSTYAGTYSISCKESGGYITGKATLTAFNTSSVKVTLIMQRRLIGSGDDFEYFCTFINTGTTSTVVQSHQITAIRGYEYRSFAKYSLVGNDGGKEYIEKYSSVVQYP